MEHVPHALERDVYTVLVQKPEEKQPITTPGCREKVTVKVKAVPVHAIKVLSRTGDTQSSVHS